MKSITNNFGVSLDFESIVALMDDDIREALHRLLAPCTDQDFFDAYCKEHQKKYGEAWEMDKPNPVW